MKHVSDGITYSGPEMYKCKNCGKRLTKEEYNDGECEYNE